MEIPLECKDDAQDDYYRKKDHVGNADNYVVRQREFCKAVKLKEGDFVTIVRKADDNERGWLNVWSPAMLPRVKLKVEDLDVDNPAGIGLSDGYQYPYFVLYKH